MTNPLTDGSDRPTPTAAPRILIVDDSPPTATALSKLLTGASYQTTAVHTGKAALAAVETAVSTGQFSAAVVDIHLGDMNGLVLAQKLRETLGNDVPILILSGDTSLETLNTLPHVGVNYFFSKPVNTHSLIERLKEWVPTPKG